MKSISWAGGPLDKATGDVLCRHTKLSSAFGSTELGPLFNRTSTDPIGWDYIWFAKGQGIEFDKWSEKLFELVIRRDNNARFQQIFSCIRNWRNTLLKIYLRNILRSGICGATLDGKMIWFSWQVETCFMPGRWNWLSCNIQQFSGLSSEVTEGIGHVYSYNWPMMWPSR
jgi:hypothetical protein